jgi:hypothetical protein
MSCLFCNVPEPNYKPDPQVDLICGNCVILLADASQDDLKKAYQKALDEGYLRKVSALESFIIPEEMENGQTKPKSKVNRRRSNRKRNVKPIGNKKERFGKAPLAIETSVLQNQQG